MSAPLTFLIYVLVLGSSSFFPRIVHRPSNNSIKCLAGVSMASSMCNLEENVCLSLIQYPVADRKKKTTNRRQDAPGYTAHGNRRTAIPAAGSRNHYSNDRNINLPTGPPRIPTNRIQPERNKMRIAPRWGTFFPRRLIMSTNKNILRIPFG